MAKKKKHIQTEKERLFQEEAARKREEKAAAAKKKRIRDAWWLVAVAGVLFALTLGFNVWTIARMHNFETNYVTIKGTITDYKLHHHTSPQKRSYTLIISYTFDGQKYEFNDTAGFRAPPDDLIGHATNIYVNPQNPEQVKKVTTAQSTSIVGAVAFPFGVAFYALGVALLLQERESSYKKRVLYIWLPAFICCVAAVLMFWIGLPNSGFGEVFSRIDGAVGFTVSGGLVLLAAGLDGIISKKLSKK